MPLPVSSYQDAARRLKEARNGLKLDQGDFAKLGGVSRNSQSAYEQGRNPFNIEYLAKLAKHGVDVGFILTGTRDNSVLTDQERELLYTFVKLSARERTAAIVLMQVLAGDSVVVCASAPGSPES